MSEIEEPPANLPSPSEPRPWPKPFKKGETYEWWLWSTISYSNRFGRVGALCFLLALFFTSSGLFCGTAPEVPKICDHRGFLWPWMGLIWAVQFWGNPFYADASRWFWTSLGLGLVAMAFFEILGIYLDSLFE